MLEAVWKQSLYEIAPMAYAGQSKDGLMDNRSLAMLLEISKS